MGMVESHVNLEMNLIITPFLTEAFSKFPN